MTYPPLPSLEKLKTFRSDQDAVSVARRLKADIRRAADSVVLEALYAAAVYRFPDDAPAQALQKFGLETMFLITELTRLGDDCRSVQAAERARLEPLMRAASKRMFACIDRLARIPSLTKLLVNLPKSAAPAWWHWALMTRLPWIHWPLKRETQAPWRLSGVRWKLKWNASKYFCEQVMNPSCRRGLSRSISPL
jgi:hypothetical protein